MTQNNERVLLHTKYLVDGIEPTYDGIRSGASLRIVARNLPDGRISISGSVSHRMQRKRASGKIFRHWQTMLAFSLLSTKANLVVLRVLDNSQNRIHTEHLFSGDETVIAGVLRNQVQHLSSPVAQHGPRHDRQLEREIRFVEGPDLATCKARDLELAIKELVGEIHTLIGPLPLAAVRFPLLKRVSSRGLCHSGQMFFRDAADFRAVAENAFGKTRYRKPLAREIERLTAHRHAYQGSDRFPNDLSILNWFRLFRGLVPIDWVIDSMRQTTTIQRIPLKPDELVQARALLLRVPQQILGRILAEPAFQSLMIIRDTVRELGNAHAQTRDLDLLPELIQARGQRRIRSARDLEALVRSIPQFRVQSPAAARSNRAIDIMVNEAQELRAMEAYNGQIRLLPDNPNPVATWELWTTPLFRATAEQFLLDYRRELMTARQLEREQHAEELRLKRLRQEVGRARWAVDTAQKLDGTRVGEYQFLVAKDASTLSTWGSQLNNCIAGYGSALGLDVFVGVLDSDGQLRLNIQINHEAGIQQFLGTNNRDARKVLGLKPAQLILDTCVQAGVRVAKHAIGVHGLSLDYPSTSPASLVA